MKYDHDFGACSRVGAMRSFKQFIFAYPSNSFPKKYNLSVLVDVFAFLKSSNSRTRSARLSFTAIAANIS